MTFVENNNVIKNLENLRQVFARESRKLINFLIVKVLIKYLAIEIKFIF